MDTQRRAAPSPPTLFWQRAGLRAGLAFGTAAGRPIEAAGQRMDPVMSALIRFVRKMPKGGPGATMPGPGGLQAFRKQYEAAPPLTGLHPDPEVLPREVPGLPGALEYVPGGPDGPRGTMLFLHGGGFIMGNPATRDALCRRLARLAGVRVVNAPYRLAPEHPFPAAHDDAAAAWAWVRENRPGPHLAGGDSAGANLAAGLPGAALTLLLYPVVDMLPEPEGQPPRYPSIALFQDGFLLTAEGMEQCAAMVAPAGTDRGDPRLSPIRGALGQAAPSVVMTAGFDPLRDQGRAWVEALHQAGRPAWLLEEPGLVHGFADFAGVVPAARRAVDRAAAEVRERLAGLAGRGGAGRLTRRGCRPVGGGGAAQLLLGDPRAAGRCWRPLDATPQVRLAMTVWGARAPRWRPAALCALR